jgi:hypothetical protein
MARRLDEAGWVPAIYYAATDPPDRLPVEQTFRALVDILLESMRDLANIREAQQPAPRAE